MIGINPHGLVIRSVVSRDVVENGKAVHLSGLTLDEARGWWNEMIHDRHALSGMVSWKKEWRSLENWLALGDEKNTDMNVIEGPAGERLALFWVNGHEGDGSTACLHVNILRKGQPIALNIGRYVLKILVEYAGYKCLMGLTPKHLRNAVAYAKSLGGVILGEIPGVCYWADKDIWEPGILSKFLRQ